MATGPTPHVLCGPLDKNPSALWVCCKQLYLELLDQDYLKATGLGGFQRLPDITAAADLQMQALRQYDFLNQCPLAVQKHLRKKHVDTIPSLYLLIKNKTFPVNANVIKTRPITSHYRHPFKRFAGHCTRGLTVLLTLAAKALGPTVSSMCLNVGDSTRYWDQAIQRYTTAEMPYLKLFEFDLDSMYYQIPQQACVHALQHFFDMFRTTFKRRNVAICRQNKQQDRIGCGSSDIYTNIPLETIMRYCTFKLQGNGTARVGAIA